MRLILSLFFTMLAGLPVYAAPFDVLVYGGTAGGAIAAVAAAGEGKRVLLVEPGAYIGGMVSGGLGATDSANKAVIGGMSRGFFERVGRHYGEPISWYFEPHVAEEIFRAMLAEAHVELRFGDPVDSVALSTGTPRSIASITLTNGESFAASQFIDASYEGDLMARAGVSYTWGREAEDVYGESLAGTREFSDKHQYSVAVNPRDAAGKLLPLLQDLPLDPPGTGDRKVQAYNFRLCMTQVAENRVAFPKPEGYDPARWELLARYLEAKPGLKVRELMNPVMMPQGKTDTNNNGPFSTDYIGGSWEYPEAGYARRKEIWEEHKRYVQGFLYFLQNDPRVPARLHEEMATWGLAKDEFTDTANWPHQLYIREARRMVGDFVMNQHDLQDARTKPDSIGMGSYNSDSHHVQRIGVAQAGPWGDATPRALNEGDMQVPVQPYEIAYRAIIPRREEATNLLVIGAFSASHVAYSSMRMEPQYMILGHAAGLAAAQAIDGAVAVQAIDVGKLQEKLRAQRAVLSVADATAPHVNAASLPGVVVDNDTAEAIGNWRASSAVGPFVGLNYLTEVEPVTPGNAVVYRAALPMAGCYELRVSYSPDGNRPKDARIEIADGDKVESRTINQRKLPDPMDPFLSLGPFDLTGTAPVVTIHPGTRGVAIADAIQWLPCPGDK